MAVALTARERRWLAGFVVAVVVIRIASLGAYLADPAAATPVFLRMHFSGVVYGWMARSFEAMKESMPADKQSQFQLQTQMFGMYEKWLRSSDFTLTATPTGIQMQQVIELNSP